MQSLFNCAINYYFRSGNRLRKGNYFFKKEDTYNLTSFFLNITVDLNLNLELKIKFLFHHFNGSFELDLLNF